jgi:hypothetical protein
MTIFFSIKKKHTLYPLSKQPKKRNIQEHRIIKIMDTTLGNFSHITIASNNQTNPKVVNTIKDYEQKSKNPLNQKSISIENKIIITIKIHGNRQKNKNSINS